MSASSQLIQIDLGPKVLSPKPSWLKAKAPVGDNFQSLKKLARGLGLHTVCESAQCPNIGECWHHKTATFMLLGDICTRRCGFCAVPKGRPEAIDWDEPRRVAEGVATLGLRHAVVTSVTRDDDNVGGARIFAETIRQIRELVPECRVEVLIPDFQGLEAPLRIVLEAKPNVLNHNTETVPRLYRAVRSGARYKRTLDLLWNAKKWDPSTVTKSGVMVGIGEETEELIEVFRDLGHFASRSLAAEQLVNCHARIHHDFGHCGPETEISVSSPPSAYRRDRSPCSIRPVDSNRRAVRFAVPWCNH